MIPPYIAAPVQQWDRPSWSSAVWVGRSKEFDGKMWTCTKIRENGRVIFWRCSDGRVARCEATPDHPDYPKDPTPKQLKADKDADEAESYVGSYTDIYG